MNGRRVAVVTGGTAGVGRAVVRELRELAQHGWDVAVLARGEAGLKGAVSDVEAAGGRAVAVPTDVADLKQVVDAAQQVHDTLGPIDLWVNNAFVGNLRFFWDTDEAEYRRITEVTYYGSRWPTGWAFPRPDLPRSPRPSYSPPSVTGLVGHHALQPPAIALLRCVVTDVAVGAIPRPGRHVRNPHPMGRTRAMTTTFDITTAGERAAEIHTAMQTHPLYGRLLGSSMRYTDCWATFTGYPVVSNWNLEEDGGPLLTEALRVLALKAAVFDLTDHDEEAAELLVPGPIDEMIHAVLAQFTVMTRLQNDLGVQFPHATENESFNYRRGADTDKLYAAAGWGEQPTRYWLGADEVNDRLAILCQRYEQAGISGHGRRHNIGFDAAPPVVAPVAG